MRGMKISFCSIGFQKNKWGKERFVERPIREIIQQVADAGYDGIEIWEPHARGLGDAELQEVRELLDNRGLAVPMLSPYFNFTTSEQTAAKSLEDARAALRLARQLKAAAIRVFTGKTASQDATEEQWTRAANCLRTLADESAADGIRWAAETHSWNLMDTVEGTLRLVNAVNRPNFGIIYQPSTLAPGHVAALEKLAPHIFHVHATNSRNKKGCRLADGELDYREIIGGLKSIGFHNFISVEWMGENPEEKLHTEAPYLRSLF
jgi:sugar phosphate isomerase/epimerase